MKLFILILLAVLMGLIGWILHLSQNRLEVAGQLVLIVLGTLAMVSLFAWLGKLMALGSGLAPRRPE